MNSLAERLFDGNHAQWELEEILDDLDVPTQRLGWDHYDCSIEIREAEPDYRLPVKAQQAIHAAGFMKAYVNHVNGWETHYGFKPREVFAESKGWRVSYPHRRGGTEKGIWVEETVPTWPAEWFETGYCIVKPRADAGPAD